MLLARAFIPSDVQEVISGLDISLCPFNYIPFKKMNSYESLINNFNFQLSDDRFSSVKLNSDSTIYNTYSFFSVTAFLIPFLIFSIALNKLINWYWIRFNYIYIHL